jgi:hypothetical protein
MKHDPLRNLVATICDVAARCASSVRVSLPIGAAEGLRGH